MTTVAESKPPSELFKSLPSGKALQLYGPCGTYFGMAHVDTSRTTSDDYYEVRCRNKRCLRDGYVTYHRWNLDEKGGCSTRREPKQYSDPRDDPGVMSLVKGQSHGHG